MFLLNERKKNERKRTINFYKSLALNPFKFHRKNHFLINSNDSKDPSLDTNNSELLFCQKENDKIMKSYHNFMKSKSLILDKNILNYLKFLEKEKDRKKYTIVNFRNKFKNRAVFNPLKLSLNKASDINYNNNSIINTSSFSPKYLKNNGSDITNPNYFDNITKKLILKKNSEILKYNINAYKSKYNKNFHCKNNFSLRKNLPLAPGKVNNPRYYFLGESKLIRNPIVNPGNRSPTYNSFNKRKSYLSP